MYQYSSQGSYPPRHTPPKTPLYDKLHRCGVEPLAPNSGLTPVDHKLAKSTLVRMAENRDRRMRKPSLSMLELSAKGTPPPVAKFSTSITPGSCALNSRLSNTSSNNEFTFSPTASRGKSNGTAPWQTLRRKFTDKINLRRFQRSNAWDRWEQQLDDWVEKMQEDQNLSPSTEPASFYDRDWSRDPLPTATECRDFPCPESPMSIIDAKMYTCLSQDPNYQDTRPSFVGSLKKQSSKTLAVVNSPLSNSPSMDDLSTCKSESKVRPGSRPRLFSFDKGKYRIPTLTIQKKSLATSSWISPKPSAPVPPSEEPTLRSLPEPFRVFTSKPVDTKSGLAETIDPNVADSLDPISQNILPELLESMESFPGVDAASLTESESQYLSWTTYATDDLDEDLRQRFYNLVGEPLSQSHRTSLSQREEPPDGTKPCIVRRKMLTSERTFTDMKIHKASTAQSGHRLRLPLGGLKNQLVDRFKPKPKAVGKDSPALAPQTMTPSVSAPCTPQHGVRHLEHGSKDRQCGAESPKLLNGAELIPLHEANASRERLMQKVEMSKTSTTPVYPVPPRLDSSRPHSSCSTGGIRPLAPRLSKVNSQYTPYRVTAPRTTGSSGSSRLSIVSSEARTTPVAPPKSAYRLLRPATPQFATTENVNPALVSAGTPRTPSMLIEGEPSIIQTPQLLTVQSGQVALVHTYSSSKCPSLTTSPDSRPISMAKNNSNPVQLGRRPAPSTPAYPQRSSGDGVPEMKHSATTQSTSGEKDDDELTDNQAGSRQAIPSGARIHTLVQSIAELILERTLNALQEEVMQSSNGARKEEPVLDKAHPGTNKEMAKASEELGAPFEKSISSDKNVETAQIPGLPSEAIEQLHKQAYRRSLQIVTNHLARRNQRSSTCMTLGDPSTVAPQTPTVTVNGGAKSRESLSRSTKAAELIQDNSVALNSSLPATATMGSSTAITSLSDPTSPTNSSTETLPHDHLVNRVNSITATEASSPSADSGGRVQRLRKSIRLSSIRHPVHHQPTSTFVVADTTAENSDSDDSDLDIAPSLGEFMRHYMKISPRPTSQSVATPIAEYHKDLSKILRPSSVRNSTKVRQSLHGLQYVERTHQHHHNPNHQIYSDDDAPSFVSQTSTISGVSHAGIVIDIDKISQQHDSPATALP